MRKAEQNWVTELNLGFDAIKHWVYTLARVSLCDAWRSTPVSPDA